MSPSTPPTSAARPPGAAQGRTVGRAIVWVLVAVGLVVAAHQLDAAALFRRALDGIAHLGMWAPVLFALLYVAAAVLFLPGFVLTLGGGAVFGLGRGIVVVWLSATLAATAAFLVGRYLARGWVQRKIEEFPRFRAVDEAVAREGWKIVLLTRLSPVFPYNVLNYAFGVTRLPLGHFVLASAVGMLPGTVLYVYIGSVARNLAGIGHGERSAAEWAFYAMGLAATLAATVLVTRIARRALDRRTHAGPEAA